jgi:uncharacterized coiled-coil protein SlyX
MSATAAEVLGELESLGMVGDKVVQIPRQKLGKPTLTAEEVEANTLQLKLEAAQGLYGELSAEVAKMERDIGRVKEHMAKLAEILGAAESSGEEEEEPAEPEAEGGEQEGGEEQEPGGEEGEEDGEEEGESEEGQGEE